MPYSAHKECNKPGCPAYQVKDGFCADHQPDPAARWRDHLSDAFYHTAAWQKFRAIILRRGVCERCGIKIATVAHHKIPIDEGGAKLAFDNMLAVCRDCHERIHGRKT